MTTMTKQKKAPWVFGQAGDRHRGVLIEGDVMTTEEAIKRGGLDWHVELRDPQSADADAIAAEEFKQVVRVVSEDHELTSWRTLGMVGRRYRVLQNKDAFKFFDKVTLEGAAVIRAVGHLDHGKTVWIVAERPETMELYPGEEIRQHLILSNSHNGSSAVHIRFAPYRVSTGTMLHVGLGKWLVNEVRIRHTKSMKAKLDTVENILGKDAAFFDRWRAALIGDGESQGMKRRIITDAEVKSVVERLFPAKKRKQEDGSTIEVVSGKAEKARSLLLERIEEQTKKRIEAEKQAGQSSNNNVTALDAFLGASEYIAKDRRTRKEGNQWVVSTFGTGAELRQKAFNLISGL